jgi:protein-disulfide isomerase
MTSEKNRLGEARSSPQRAKRESDRAPSSPSSAKPDERPRLYPLWSVIAVALIAWSVVGGFILVSASGAERLKSVTTTQAYYDGLAMGPRDAKVQIIMYSDFQCPNCGEFAREALKQIEETYVSKGLVRLEYRHCAYLGPESEWAAEASEAANEQGLFWPYYNTLFANQRGENKGTFSLENLKRFAAELDLDQKAFDAALDSGKYADKIASDFQAARQAGVEGTPTFFIKATSSTDPQVFVGNFPFETFQQAIEEELRK